MGVQPWKMVVTNRTTCALLFLYILGVSDAACPFKRLATKHKRGITLATVPPTLQRARDVGSKVACFPPLCVPGQAKGPSRRLLSSTQLGTNGFPELYSTTVTAIKDDFCAVLNGGCNNDYNGVTSGYTAD